MADLMLRAVYSPHGAKMLDKSIHDRTATADTAGGKRGGQLARELVAIIVLLAIGVLFIVIRTW